MAFGHPAGVGVSSSAKTSRSFASCVGVPHLNFEIRPDGRPTLSPTRYSYELPATGSNIKPIMTNGAGSKAKARSI